MSHLTDCNDRVQAIHWLSSYEQHKDAGFEPEREFVLYWLAEGWIKDNGSELEITDAGKAALHPRGS